MVSDIQKLTRQITAFIAKRNWGQFHNPKDLAISLVLESNEVLEHFQWKSEKEIAEYLKTDKKEVAKELADTLYWVLLLSKNMNIDIVKAFEEKMKINEKKYPVEKSKSNKLKYTKL